MSGDTVLITGLNSFVGCHTALKFLQNGWRVKGTVRSREKGENVLNLPVFKDHRPSISYTVVESLEEGDFTEALSGVNAVAHVASPWHFTGKTWDEYAVPAVKGTVNILGQAARPPASNSIKAIAAVSSWAAVGDCCDPFTEHIGQVYTEKNWLPQGKEEAENKVDNGDHSAQVLWYCASKKEAELAAMDFVKEAKPSWSLGFVNPPSIYGPPIHLNPTAGKEFANADVSTTRAWTTLAGGSDAQIPHTVFPIWADVTAVAQAMYEIITRRENGRFLICNGNYDFEILNRTAQKLRPDLVERGIIPRGQMDGPTPTSAGVYTLDVTKSRERLGIEYASLEEVVKSIMDHYEASGLLGSS